MEPSGYNFQRYYPFQKDTNKPRWSRNVSNTLVPLHEHQQCHWTSPTVIISPPCFLSLVLHRYFIPVKTNTSRRKCPSIPTILFMWTLVLSCVRVCTNRCRLRVVSNFGGGDCGAGEIHTCALESSRRRDAKGAPKIRDYRQSQGF